MKRILYTILAIVALWLVSLVTVRADDSHSESVVFWAAPTAASPITTCPLGCCPEGACAAGECHPDCQCPANQVRLFLFVTEGCAPCVTQKSRLMAAGVPYREIHTTPEQVATYKLRVFPTLIAYRGQRQVARLEGLQDAAAVRRSMTTAAAKAPARKPAPSKPVPARQPMLQTAPRVYYPPMTRQFRPLLFRGGFGGCASCR